jgi:transposase
MRKVQFFCGIDVGKNELFVALQNGLQLISESVFENTVAGLSALLDWLEEREAVPGNTLIALEHTGVYGERLLMVAHGAEYAAWTVNPMRLSQVQLGLDRGKDDPGDARKIAAFAARFADQAVLHEPDSKAVEDLKALATLRRQIVGARQKSKNQFHALKQKPNPLPLAIEFHKAQIQKLTEYLKKVEEEIEACIKEHQNLAEQTEILKSIPGIGMVTSTQFIVLTKGFSTLNDHKKLAAFVGTAPYPNSSGENAKWRKNKISKKGNSKLKALLTTSVMSTIRKGGYFHDLYQILLRKPGIKNMQVINRIRNILLKLMVVLVRKGEKFDPETFKKNCETWQNALTLT